MTSNQFYISRVGQESSRVFLAGEEHHHLSRVARVRPGEKVRLFDGTGMSCLARVETVSTHRTELIILLREEGETPVFDLALAQGLMTSKKMEFILQKTVELGISEFIPLETVCSLKALPQKSGRKTERWERIAREAIKQSKGTSLPAVRAPVSLTSFLETTSAHKRIYLSERKGVLLKNLILGAVDSGEITPPSALLAVGPEGGWTEGEEEALRKHGFEAASLGPRILRAETAALTAAAMMIHFWST